MRTERRWKAVALLATGIMIGVVTAGTPAGAHVGGTVNHLWNTHVRPKADTRYANAVAGTDKAKDANRLDGLDSAAFLRAGATAADANLLDGLDSTEFLGVGAKAADANMLDGRDSTSFMPSSGLLPSGVTLRGLYGGLGSASAAGSRANAWYSFGGFELPAALTPLLVHYVNIGQTPPPACPGSLGNPEAAPGHLCVYEHSNTNAAQPLICGLTFCPETEAVGFGILVESVNAGLFGVRGSWAVTAP